MTLEERANRAVGDLKAAWPCLDVGLDEVVLMHLRAAQREALEAAAKVADGAILEPLVGVDMSVSDHHRLRYLHYEQGAEDCTRANS